MYLRLNDYIKSIEISNLNQITSNDSNIRIDAERAAQEEITSYLTQKYDLVEEFTDITIYDPTLTYSAGITVELSATTVWNSSTTYIVDTLINYLGNIYQTTGTTISGATSYLNMKLLGPINKLYHTIIPNDYWNYDEYYIAQDKVYWRGKVYTAANNGSGYVPDNKQIKIHLDPSFGVINYETTLGTQYWGTGTNYSVPADSLLNTTYFATGDFRSQQMVQKMVDISLYHIHKRIAPKNVPDVRAISYDAAIEWLKGCAAGDITPNLRVKTYRQGGSFIISSTPKNYNNY
jgi:hypothetical protein